MNIRCIYCNWLNKEVKNNFVCKNCEKDNEQAVKEIKEVSDEKENIQLNSKRRFK